MRETRRLFGQFLKASADKISGMAGSVVMATVNKGVWDELTVAITCPALSNDVLRPPAQCFSLKNWPRNLRC